MSIYSSGSGEGFYLVRNAAGQLVCAYIQRVNGASQSDVELERARRVNEIHRSTQLTNCSPSVIRHYSLCLSSLSFSRASIPRRGEEPATRVLVSNEPSFHRKLRFRVLFVIFSVFIQRVRMAATGRFQRALEMIHLTDGSGTFIGHWVYVSMAFESS